MRKFTGYIIRKDFDLKNLKKYGFFKTEPKETNIWWQRPFGINLNKIITWDAQLLVNINDRKLLMQYEDDCNLDDINNIIEEMKQNGIFI